MVLQRSHSWAAVEPLPPSRALRGARGWRSGTLAQRGGAGADECQLLVVPEPDPWDPGPGSEGHGHHAARGSDGERSPPSRLPATSGASGGDAGGRRVGRGASVMVVTVGAPTADAMCVACGLLCRSRGRRGDPRFLFGRSCGRARTNGRTKTAAAVGVAIGAGDRGLGSTGVYRRADEGRGRAAGVSAVYRSGVDPLVCCRHLPGETRTTRRAGGVSCGFPDRSDLVAGVTAGNLRDHGGGAPDQLPARCGRRATRIEVPGLQTIAGLASVGPKAASQDRPSSDSRSCRPATLRPAPGGAREGGRVADVLLATTGPSPA